MAPFMLATWEGKSSWLGAGYTCPGRVIGLMGMILHQFGGEGGKEVRSGFDY